MIKRMSPGCPYVKNDSKSQILMITDVVASDAEMPPMVTWRSIPEGEKIQLRHA